MNLDDLIIIDCEASGLSQNSYPIEIGVAYSRDSFGFLIKPAADWTYWDLVAEKIHNIKREDLENSGISVYDAVNILNSQLRGLTVYSDAFDFETFWIDKLYSAVGVERNFKIESIYMLNLNFEKYKKEKKLLSKNITTHRAENDSLIIRESIIKSFK